MLKPIESSLSGQVRTGQQNQHILKRRHRLEQSEMQVSVAFDENSL